MLRASVILVGLAVPAVAMAQSPPFCMPQATAQSVAAALQTGQAAWLLMQDAATAEQRQAAAVAAAVAKQRDEDAKPKAQDQVPPVAKATP